jgi:hypothetical protein|tara:strand:- start:539 stop:910 length:372 start_codon:yes stop_codon:yes gene_type:complete
MARQLTEKQQKFLDVLFDEARGDPTQAKKLAGYADSVATAQVVSSVEDEVVERTKKFIAQSSTKAAYTMFSVMADPTDLGVKEKMMAAKDILDRAGFTKTEKVEVKTSEPLFILPSKDVDAED